MFEQQILEAILEIVKTGGFYGVLGVFVWGLMPIIKITIVMGFLCATVRFIMIHVNNFYKMRLDSRNTKISLLSEQASSHLLKAMNSMKENFEKSNQDLMQVAQNLKEKSEKIKKGEPV